jgi:hypothetical protein
MSMPEDYRNKFIAQLHNALSGYTGLDVDEAVRYDFLSSIKTIFSSFSSKNLGSQSKANQKQSESQSKRDRTIVSDLTSPKCSDMVALVSKSAFNLCTKM